MVYAKKAKELIQRELMYLLSSEPQSLARFVARMKLETGLTEMTISEVLGDMGIVDLIRIEEGIIYKP